MSDGLRFEKLLKPIRIGQIELKNRIVMPAMGTNLGTRDGFVTERLKDYYEVRARGGVGLIIVEATYVVLVGKTATNLMGISDDKFISGLSEVAEVIHRHGAKAALQLQHGGRLSVSWVTGIQPVAPSAIPLRGYDNPKELTLVEIEQLPREYAKAAQRAKEAGFDGLEIHAAGGYLLCSFLSAASNKRQDAYGGELKNRARLLLEIIRAVKEAVGEDFPVWYRASAQELGVRDGITLEEAMEVAQMAQSAGADAINVYASGGWNYTFPSMGSPPGILVPLAQSVKKVVNIPVMTVGKITPEAGERALKEGKADLIGMGRALIADPELPLKVVSGRLEDVNPCICCLHCLGKVISYVDKVSLNGEISCVVNPALGREKEYELREAKKRKKVIVVGGGPGGMETARVAAMRGHAVTLYEKGDRLGGQLLLAVLPPEKDEIGDLVNYLSTQVRKLGVRVELGREVTPELISEQRPDAVVLATGVLLLVPEIPGMEKAKVITAERALTDESRVGESVVVLGGGLVGCETADFLAERGRKVTVVEMLDKLVPGMMTIPRRILLDKLTKRDVRGLTSVKGESVTEEGLVIVKENGEREMVEADTIILAMGSRSNQRLYDALKEKVPEIHLVGDCVKPRRIMDAIAEGSYVGHIL